MYGEPIDTMMVHKTLIKRTIKPRVYQEVIAASTRTSNLLCVLPTGLGKTLVSILSAAHRLSEFPKSKILCLAPTKPLVVQLRNEFARSLNFNDSLFSVLTGHTSPKERKEVWKSAKFIFATPQTVESDILRGHLKLSDFSLAIFDECVTGDTEILLANGRHKKVKNLIDDIMKGKVIYVRSYDAESNKFVNRRVTNALSMPGLKRIFKIKAGNRCIKVTEDHPFLTHEEGLLKWKKARDITLGTKIGTVINAHAYKKGGGAKPIIGESDIIETYSKDLQENIKTYQKTVGLRSKFGWGSKRIGKELDYSESQIRNWIYNGITPKPILTVNALKELGLLPFSYSSPNVGIIARLVGHLFGDGWFYVPNKSKATLGFSGKVEDLKEIQKDLDILNLKYSSIHSRKTRSKVNGKEIKGTTNSFTCTDKRLTRLLLALNAPSGRFSTQKINVPTWIMNGPLHIKREFLASLFGSDGETPSNKKGSQSMYCIRFSLNQKAELETDMVEYLKEIKSLLAEFGVAVSNINIKDGTTWKDGTKTLKGILTVANSPSNMIKLFENVSYAYCLRKERLATSYLNYLVEKEDKKSDLSAAYESVLDLKKEGYDNWLIAKNLGLPLHRVEKQVYSKSGLVKPLLNINEYDPKKTARPLKWVVVSELREVERELVYDVSIEDTANFVANGFVVHNCHRAVGNYAYTWIAKQYGAVEQARILGLTASPASDKEKLDEICKNLKIEKIEVRSERDPDVAPYVKEKEVTKVEVELPVEIKGIRTLLEEAMRPRLKTLKNAGLIASSDVNKVRKLELLNLQKQLAADHRYDPDKYTQISIIASCLKLQHIIMMVQTQSIESVVDFFKKIEKQAKTVKASKRLLADLNFKNAVIQAYDAAGQGIEHPKMQALRDLVSKEVLDGKKVIIFASYRSSIERIVKELEKLEGINPRRFIGQKDGMSQREQIAAIERFKEGKYNVLVCSSIAEEGLSIESVPTAIFYESVGSALRSIQRKGRVGRTEIGEIYILITKNTIDEAYYWASKRKERRMYELLEDLKESVAGKQITLGEF